MPEQSGIPHQLLEKGVKWVDSEASDDFMPHIPKYEYEHRITKAKETLVRHGVDPALPDLQSGRKSPGFAIPFLKI